MGRKSHNAHERSGSESLPGQPDQSGSGLQVDLQSLTPIAKDAMAVLERELRVRLLDGSLLNGLQSEPDLEPHPPATEGDQDDVIEQAGESLFTRSIGIDIPHPGRLLMKLSDRTIRILAHLPGHDARLRSWARLSCERRPPVPRSEYRLCLASSGRDDHGAARSERRLTGGDQRFTKR